MGRAPDYKAAFLATLGANSDFYDPYQDNAKRWYKFSQERVPFINHAIIHPPVDRDRPPNEVADVCCHVEKETDAGLIVSGAKVVATGSVLTNYTFVAHHGLIPLQDKKFAAVFMVPTNAPGVKFICRTSYEMSASVMGSPFDYPISSRLDENDAVFIMDKVLVPWENVFVYGDIEKANNFFPRTGFLPRFVVHGCTRLAVKLDFISGLLLKATEAAGTKDYRGVQANVGEVIAWRNLFWSLSDAMVRDPKPWIGDYVLPNMDPGNAYQIIATMAYTKVKYLIEQTVASGLIYLNSHSSDFKNAEIRPYLDRYLRGSNGYKAEERVKLLKLLWDCIGSEFGGRHELYEINYGGSTEEIRRYCLFGAQASGNADRFKGFAEDCMAEYDLDGWKVPDLTDPGELSYHMMREVTIDAERRRASIPNASGRSWEHFRPESPSLRPNGMANCSARPINSLTSVSLEPCMLLFCTNEGSATGAAIRKRGLFSVNILGQHQSELSARFTGQLEEPLRGSRRRRSAPTACRCLQGAAAQLCCRVATVHKAGDHDIILGEVLSGEEIVCSPLVFHKGTYGSFQRA